MRVLKWVLLLLFVVVLIPVGGVASLLSGMWSYNMRLEQGSYWLNMITERTGMAITVDRPIFLKLGGNFSVNTGAVKILNPTDGRFTETTFAQFSELDMVGELSLGVLWGELPLIEELMLNDLIVNIQRDEVGNPILPKMAYLPKFSPILGGFAPIQTAYAQEFINYLDVPVNEATASNVMINIIDPSGTKILQISSLRFVKPRSVADGYLRMESNFDGAPVTIDIAATRQWDISGDIALLDTTLHLQGDLIASNVDMNFVLVVDDTKKITEFFKVALPTGPFRADVDMTFKRNLLKVKLNELLTRNSDLKGDFDFSIRGRALIGGLEGKHLRVSDFLPPASTTDTLAKTLQATNSNDPRVIPNTPLPAFLFAERLLPEFSDAEITFKVAHVELEDLVLSDVRGKIDADDKGAAINLENVSLGLGGKLRGFTDLKVGAVPTIIMDVSLETMPISTLQPFVPMISKFDGAVNAVVSGKTSGKTVRDLAAGYDGILNFSLYDGYVHLPPQMAQILSSISSSILENGLLILQCIDLNSKFDQGVDSKVDAVLLSNALHAHARGSVDLAQENLDVNSITELSIIGNSMGLVTPITGKFGAPDVQPDYSGLFSGNTQNTLAVVDGGLSRCHEQVGARMDDIDGEYDGLPANHLLGSILQNGELKNLGGDLGTIQEKLLELQNEGTGSLTDTLKDKATEKLQETLSEKAEAVLKDRLGSALGGASDAGGGLESLGKSLLGGLGN